MQPVAAPARAATAVTYEEAVEPLSPDIRRLGDVLGRTLAAEEGAEAIALVERARRVVRAPDEAGALADLLDGLDRGTPGMLARSSTGFLQLHRRCRPPTATRPQRRPSTPTRTRGRPPRSRPGRGRRCSRDIC